MELGGNLGVFCTQGEWQGITFLLPAGPACPGGQWWQFGPHQGRDALGDSPLSLSPCGQRKEPGERHDQTYKSVPKPSARSYEVPVSQDGRMAFPLCSPGMCCNGAAASILCPPPRRGGVSASARVTRHTLPPPATKFGSTGRGSPPLWVPSAGIAPPPALSGSRGASLQPPRWVPSAAGPHQVRDTPGG